MVLKLYSAVSFPSGISKTSKQNSSHSRLCKTPCAESILIHIWQNEEQFQCVHWNEPGFCYCEFPHPFLWLKAGAAPASVCLVRKKSSLGPCLEGSLEPSVFRRRLLGQTWLPPQGETAAGSSRADMDHQKPGDLASWFISQLSPLGASITHWIKRKLLAAQLKFHPVCSWSDSNKLGL